MYNFSFSAVLPFTAAAVGFDRLLKSLIGIIIIPLLTLIGISAIMSDFDKIRPINSNNQGFTSQLNNLSVCNKNQQPGFSSSGGSVPGNVWGKGIILFPSMPGDQLINSSSNKDCDKIKAIGFDSTIYLSPDMVDSPPELIWMIYPDLSKADIGDVPSVQITLSILVDYSGKPLEVTIADETLIGHSAKQIILESARTAVFKPAQKNNQSVNCWVQIPLELEV